MKNRDAFLESANLYVQASKLILSTRPLQLKIQVCNNELMFLIDAENTHDKKVFMHNLNDEIFSCQVEIQVLRVKANRLIKQARCKRDDYTQIG